MLTAAVSAFLYLRIVVNMYFVDPDDSRPRPAPVAIGARIALTLAVLGTIALGVVPGPFTRLADDAKPVLVASSPSSSDSEVDSSEEWAFPVSLSSRFRFSELPSFSSTRVLY